MSLKSFLRALFLPIYRLSQKLAAHPLSPSLSAPADAFVEMRGHFTHGPGVFIQNRVRLVTGPRGEIVLGEGVYLGREVELGTDARIQIGAHTSLQDRCIVLGDVRIGSGCTFAPQVYLSSGTHHFDRQPTWFIRDQDNRARAEGTSTQETITIGEDCWLGINVFVAPGVTIGRGCVVGANSVVTKDLPPYSVAVGAPARVIKQRLIDKPPAQLDPQRDEDLAYFDRGFRSWQADLASSRARGGIWMNREFSLRLQPSNRPLVLHLVSEAPGLLRQLPQGPSITIAKGEADYQFSPVTHDGQWSFAWENEDFKAGSVILKAARLLD